MIAAFVAGLGLGAVVAAQVGPVSLLCVRTGLRFGFRPALAVGAGAALVDALYGAAALIGLGGALQAGSVRLALGLIGAAVLVVMGARTLWSAHRVRLGLEVDSEVVTPAAALRTALAATASNPLTIVFWATAFAAASTASVVATSGDAVALLAGVATGSLAWFATLATAVVIAGRRIRDRSLYAVDLAAGTGLIGFGALLGFRTIRDT
jgi:threonine/homoserine/homoserine lactone efflux protein